MNKVSVTINGMEYSLKGVESAEYLQGVGQYVDSIVKEITLNNPSMAKNSMVALAAVRICDDMMKLKEKYNADMKAAQEVYDESEKLKHEKENLLAQIKGLEAYRDELLIKLENDSNEEQVKFFEEQVERLTRENQELAAAHLDSVSHIPEMTEAEKNVLLEDLQEEVAIETNDEELKKAKDRARVLSDKLIERDRRIEELEMELVTSKQRQRMGLNRNKIQLG